MGKNASFMIMMVILINTNFLMKFNMGSHSSTNCNPAFRMFCFNEIYLDFLTSNGGFSICPIIFADTIHSRFLFIDT